MAEVEGEEAAESEELAAAARNAVPRPAQIEESIEAATKDRSKAFELKQELDRLGIFKQYEDRFLDLFKKPE
ncbi:MAG: hypothetical protein U0792_23900 [Gemmataceae bacterium]